MRLRREALAVVLALVTVSLPVGFAERGGTGSVVSAVGTPVITGSSAVTSVAVSASGSWQVAVTADGSYRSADGVVWEFVGEPLGRAGGSVAIDDAGVVFYTVDFSSGTSAELWVFDSSWVKRSTFYMGGWGWQKPRPTLLLHDGSSVVVLSSRGKVVQSDDGGLTWSTHSFMSKAPASAVVRGDVVHVIDVNGSYKRWSLSSKSSLSASGSFGSSSVLLSAPGSVSEVYAVGDSFWRSLDAGASWTEMGRSELTPARDVELSQAVMNADGDVRLSGFGDIAGSMSVVEVTRDPALSTITNPLTVSWSGVGVLDSGLASGSLRVGPSQLVDGTVIEPLRLVSVAAGSLFDVYSVTGPTVSDPWPTSTSSEPGSVAVSGLASAPDRVVMSPSGSWQMISVLGGVLRSSDGESWEWIGWPSGAHTVGNGAIDDAGNVFLATKQATGFYKPAYFWRFVDGEWYGGNKFLTFPPAVYTGPGGIAIVGSELFVVETKTGRVATSPDWGLTWSTSGDLPDAAVFQLMVRGSDVHAASSKLLIGGVWTTTYSRYGMDSYSRELSATFSAELNLTSAPGSSTDIFLAGGAELYSSVDGGDSWTGEALGSTALSEFRVTGEPRLRGYGTAQCTAGNSVVYEGGYDLGSGAGWNSFGDVGMISSGTATVLSVRSAPADGPAGSRDVWVAVDDGGTWSVYRFADEGVPSGSAFGFDEYGWMGLGVSAATGNFTEAVTDTSIAGVGPSLELTRTYNSSDARVGLFGRGWTSTFETRVFENCVTGDAIVLHGDGRREMHVGDGNGGYTRPDGYTSILETAASGWTYTATDGTVKDFRSDGRLTKVTDADGQSLDISWNAADELASVTDATSGRALSFAYASGRVSSMSTTPVTINSTTAALTWNYVYDDDRLSAVCEPRNNNPTTGWCAAYGYTDSVLTSIVDANGNIDKAIDYQAGQAVSTLDGEGNQTSYVYGPTSTTVTDPNGRSTTTEFDNQYRLTKETDALSGETVYDYNSAGFRYRTTDANGDVTALVLDPVGNVLEETNGADETTYFAYDAYNNLTGQRDARSVDGSDGTYLTSSTWSGVTRRRLTQTTPPTVQQPSGTTSTWTYTSGAEPAVGGGTMPAGLLRTSTDPNGGVATHDYDSVGDLRRLTARSGLVTEYVYDELGRQTQQTVISDTFPNGVTTTVELDELGNEVAVTGPPVTNAVTADVHQLNTTSVFDPAGRLIQQAESDVGGSASPDPTRVTTYSYDAADRVIAVTDAANGVSSNEYDAAGNLTATVDESGRRIEYSFDERNLVTGATGIGLVTDEGAQSARNVTLGTAVYDAEGRLTETTDAAGRLTRFTYDNADRQTSATRIGHIDPDGTVRDVIIETTSYDAAGNPTSSVTGNGLRTETSVFDEAGRNVSRTLDPGGLARTITSTFDANGNLTSTSLSDAARTEQTRYFYDVADRLVSETVENGAIDLVTSYTYDQRGALTSTVDPRGNATGAVSGDFRTDYVNDEYGRLVKTASPPVDTTDNGVTITVERPELVVGYNTFGESVAERDERNNITSSSNDALGRTVARTYPTYVPSGGVAVTPVETFAYDAVGNLTQRTDPRGQTTMFTYDGLDRVATRTDPAVATSPAGVSGWFYDDSGNVIVTVDSLGARIETSYDSFDRPRTVVEVVRNATATPDLYSTDYGYDDLHNQTSITSPAGDVTTLTYSPASEQLTTTDAQGNTTTFGYDVSSRQTSITDALSRTAETVFDLAGRSTETTSKGPGGTILITSTAGYDEAGNLTSLTSPRGNEPGATATDFTTTYGYDALNRLTVVAEPTTSTTAITTNYGYDTAGNTTAVTDGRGSITSYSYNEWNLQTSIVEPSTTTDPALADRSWLTEYDAGGFPIRTTEPGGVIIDRTFNELGQLVTETGAGTDAPTATRAFGYDTAGYLTSASSPAGDIGFDYDDRGLLTASTGPTQYQATFGYDDNGRMTARNDASGNSIFTYTSRNQMATATDPLTGTTSTNTYDVAGQLSTTVYSDGTDTSTRTVAYNDLGRLTSDSLSDGTATTAAYTYSYNADGSLTTKAITLPTNPADGAYNYTYDNAGRLTSTTDPATAVNVYTWDDAGNLTNAAGTTQSFDERNRLTQTGATTNTWTPRGTLLTTTTGTNIDNYTYDGLGRATATPNNATTYDSLDRINTNNTATFSYAGTEIDAGAIDNTLIARTPDGQPTATRNGTNPATLIGQNSHGDTTYTYTANGTVDSTTVYDPLGNPIATTGTTPAIGFQSDYTNPTTGETWMGARWYQPGTGTFNSRDTIFGNQQTPTTLNRYTYALADPLGRTDPDGRFSIGIPDFVRTGVEAVTDTAYAGGQIFGDFADVGEQTPASAVVDPDGPMVLDIQEILANPEIISSTQRLSNAPDILAGIAKGVIRESVAPLYTALEGRNINTLQSVSLGERAVAIAETALTVVFVAVRAFSVARNVVNATRRININPRRIANAPRTQANKSTRNIQGEFAPSYRLDTVDRGSFRLPGSVAPNRAPVGGDLTTVGRWMDPSEHAAMVRTGEVQVGNGGATFVASPASSGSYMPQAAPGSHYVEFDVPTNSLFPGGRPDWAQIPSPDHLLARLAAKRGDPVASPVTACNIIHVATKLGGGSC